MGSPRRGLALFFASVALLLGCRAKQDVTPVRPPPTAAASVAPARATPQEPPRPPEQPSRAALADPPWRDRNNTDQQAELARFAGRLSSLRRAPPGQRASCAQFRSVELQELVDHADRSRGVVNACSKEAAELLKCVETPTGFFVPVGVAFDLCSYRLWYVPRAVDEAPVPVSDLLQEFDIEYTLRLAADDFDGDSVTEALLIRGWSHPEGVGEARYIWLVEPTGQQRELPFTDMKDVDGDGRVDALVSFDELTNAAGCEPPDQMEAWVARSLTGPTLVLHRVAGGKFSLTDEAARAARAKSCQNLGKDVVAWRGREVNEDETLRRAVCRLADGDDPVTIKSALEKACSRDYEMPTDCKRLRPGVCFWRSSLLGLPGVLETLKPWLTGS